MDDILTILFYLIILVVGGLISANSAKKKRRPVSRPSSSPDPGPIFDTSTRPASNPLDDFLKRFEIEQTPVNETAEPESEPEPELETNFDDQPQIVSLEEIVTKPEEEGQHSIQMPENQDFYEHNDNLISAGEITDIITDDEIKHDLDFNIGEDIIEGIIYSEILKRKQF